MVFEGGSSHGLGENICLLLNSAKLENLNAAILDSFLEGGQFISLKRIEGAAEVAKSVTCGRLKWCLKPGSCWK
jgi:hypothetical protein